MKCSSHIRILRQLGYNNAINFKLWSQSSYCRSLSTNTISSSDAYPTSEINYLSYGRRPVGVHMKWSDCIGGYEMVSPIVTVNSRSRRILLTDSCLSPIGGCRSKKQITNTGLDRNLLKFRNFSTGYVLASEVGSPLQEKVTLVSAKKTEEIATVLDQTTLVVDNSSIASKLVEETLIIPDAPEVLTFVETAQTVLLNAAGEPSIASLGLGGWYPPGLIRTALEMLHANLGMPWWAAILTGTIVVRILLLPLVVKSQKNAAKMHNNLPQMQAIQLKLTEARQSGNQMMAAKYGHDLMTFMKEKEVNPLKSMLVPIAMTPVFLSFFIGLRKMANLPVESLKEGGMFWFADLTVADPFYLLPVMTCVTLWITLEVGADGVRMSSQHGNLIKYVMRAMPVIVFPFTMNFPAALLCYWLSSNAVSLVQVSILKLPNIRTKLGIEPLLKFETEALPMQKKGFVGSVKDAWTNVRITNEMDNRERYDEISFKRAGRGPLPKTYKYDPTKAQSATTAVGAKAIRK